MVGQVSLIAICFPGPAALAVKLHFLNVSILDIQHLSICLCGQCPLFYCLLHLFLDSARQVKQLYTQTSK